MVFCRSRFLSAARYHLDINKVTLHRLVTHICVKGTLTEYITKWPRFTLRLLSPWRDTTPSIWHIWKHTEDAFLTIVYINTDIYVDVAYIMSPNMSVGLMLGHRLRRNIKWPFIVLPISVDVWLCCTCPGPDHYHSTR